MIIFNNLNLTALGYLLAKIIFKQGQGFECAQYLDCTSKACNYLKKYMEWLFKIKISEISFYAGDFALPNNDNLWITNKARCAEDTIKKSQALIESNSALRYFSELFTKKNILKVVSSCLQEKHFKNHLDFAILKALKLISKNFKFIVVQNELPDTHKIPGATYLEIKNCLIPFYKLFIIIKITILAAFSLPIILLLSPVLILLQIIIKKVFLNYPCKILTQEEGHVSNISSLRMFPFWNTQNSSKKNLVCVFFSNKITDLTLSQYKQGFGLAIKLPRLILFSYAINSLNNIFGTLKLFFKSYTQVKQYSELKILVCLHKVVVFSYLISAFCKKNNIKCAVSSENYFIDAMAFGFCRTLCSLKFFSFQYSIRNCAVPPTMLANCDILFTYSNKFNNYWNKTLLKPKQIISFGYYFHCKTKKRVDEVQVIKSYFLRRNIKIIILFLDESLQNNKYGLIKPEAYLNDLEKLITFCRKNSGYGLLLKPQFIWNSIDNLTISHNLKLKKSDRHFMFESITRCPISKRNLITPRLASLASDCVISHSFSGTAGFECALCNKPTFLLNSYACSNMIQKIFHKNKNILLSLDDMLSIIKNKKRNKIFNQNKLSWKKVFHELNIEKKFNAADKVYKYLCAQAI